MMYIADTHALIWHLSGDERLGKKAAAIFAKADKGESEVVLPTVVLAEALYISRKGHVSFDQLIDSVSNARNYSVYPLGLNVILEMRKLGAGYSIHDAVIVASARLLDAALLTRDEMIRKGGDAKVIW
jgi:predicted nucleic acid-binding protein